MDAYLESIRRTVQPGSVVVDVGSGVGIFALAACRAGARRVYAIEPGAIVQVAREIAAANGVASRVEFIEQLSTCVTLPEPADVVILDVRGVLPDDQIPIALDARRRFLRDGGHILPSADVLWAAPASMAGFYDEHIGVWDRDEDGVDLGPLRQHAVNRYFKCRVRQEDLIAEPRRLGTIDYRSLDSPDVHYRATWTIASKALAHGFVLWFDTEVYEDVGFSNRPGAPDVLYGQAFFPWPERVALDAGQTVALELIGSSGAHTYDWRWRTSVATASSSNAIAGDFDQSTARPAEWDGASAHGSFVPSAGEVGAIDRLILDSMTSKMSNADIARFISDRYATRFPRFADALAHVGRLAALYG